MKKTSLIWFALVAGCGASSVTASDLSRVVADGGSGGPGVDPAMSTFTVDRSSGVRADGADKVTFTVTLRDGTGALLAGRSVLVGVSGGDVEVTQPPVTDESGVARGTLTSTRPGAKTLSALVDPGLTPVLLASQPTVQFVGTAARLAFTLQPTSTSLAAPLTVDVEVQDAAGNRVPDATHSVQIALVGPAATLRGTTTAAALGGEARFTDLWVDRVGTGYTLLATAAGLEGAFSISFDVTSGSAGRLRFKIEPANALPGATLAPIEVEILDANGALASSATDVVELRLAESEAATLTGTRAAAAVGGVARFTDLAIDRAGVHQLAAWARGFAEARSAGFTVGTMASPSPSPSPMPMPRLSFLTQPTNAAPAATIAPPVQVELLDGNGNRMTGATAAVTLTFGSNPTSALLSGTTTVNMVAGVASFSNLSVDKAGSGFTLSASTSLAGVTSGVSNAFNIAFTGPRLSFVTQPTSKTVNTPIPVAVEILDAGGARMTGATDAVTIAIGANPAGGVLAGTKTVNAVSGVATFSDLSIDKPGAGYTLLASASGISGVTSQAFGIGSITPAGSRLVFSTQPISSASGAQFQVVVQVQDGVGNVISGANDSITIGLFTNLVGGTVSGTLTRSAVNGTATFPGLALNNAGGGYSLFATATGLEVGISVGFEIFPGQPAVLVARASPSGSYVAGTILTPAAEFELQDAAGNFVPTATNSVSITLGNNTNGATLSGTTTVSAIGGVATFANLSIDKTRNSYYLRASGTNLIDGDSGSFSITADVAVKLGFLVQPTNALAGAPFSPFVGVSVQDQFGNTVTSASGSITVAIGNNPGGATLAGTLTRSTSNGVATFNNTGGTTISLNKVNTGYTLVASGFSFANVTSNAFDVAPGNPAALEFLVEPVDTVAGVAIAPAVKVRILDSSGNFVPTASNSISIARQSGTGTLAGTSPVSAVSGVASFSDLSLTPTGAKTLRASGSGLGNKDSASFTIVADVPHNTLFTGGTQPGQTVAGVDIAGPPLARVRDQFNNACTNYNGPVTMVIGTNPGSGTLSGTTTVNAVSGGATFDDIQIDKVGTGYTLVAQVAGGTTFTPSSAFNITPAGAAKLGFIVQPSDRREMEVVAPAVQVAVQDTFGNTVATPGTRDITLIVGSNSGGGTLFGDVKVTTVSNVATFPGLQLDKPGAYTLIASTPSLTSGTSATFNITGGAWAPRNNGLDAGRVLSLAVDPVTPTTLYAGTYGGGLFKSTDAGASWSPMSTGLRNRIVTAIGIDPTVPSTIYVGTDLNNTIAHNPEEPGLFKSTDSGATWIEQFNPPQCCSEAVHQLVVVKGAPSTVWGLKGSGRVTRTTDGGANWVLTTGAGCNQLAADPVDPLTAYVTCGNRIYKTSNGGVSYALSEMGRGGNAIQIVIHPDTPSTLYSGNFHGTSVDKSTNSGNNWAPANTGLPTGFPQGLVLLVMAPSAPDTLYALMNNNQIYRTTNGGGNWTVTGSTGLVIPAVLKLAVNPTAPDTVYAGLDGPGVAKTTDAAANWSRATAGIQAARVGAVAPDPSNGSIVYVATQGGGAFKTVDGGATWSPLQGGLDRNVSRIAVSKSNGQVVYAVSPAAAFRSINGGTDWTQVHTPPADFEFSSVVVDPLNADVAYLGYRKLSFMVNGDVAKTVNGTSFSPLLTPANDPISSVAIDPLTPAVVWAVCQNAAGAFRSPDSGTSWLGRGTTPGKMFSVAIDPVASNTLYLGGENAVWKTVNGGVASPTLPTWTSQGQAAGLPAGTEYIALGIDPTATGTVYTGGKLNFAGSNVYRTVNGGTTWTFAGSGVVNPQINALAHDPAGTGVVWTGTEGAGVFRTTTGGQ